MKKKMGSGQRMQLLLRIAARSSKEHIFLDEPERYSHPSLLNATAQAINELVAKGKSVSIATHSAKLASMFELILSDISVINDPTHVVKPIPFDESVVEACALMNVGNMPAKFKRYHDSDASLMECVQKRHGRMFIEALFTNVRQYDPSQR